MSDPVFATAEECEAAFYAAFMACDVDAMMAVWATQTPVLCIHPGALPLAGRDAVARSWREILGDGDGGGAVRITLTDRREMASGEVCVRYVHENIHHGPGLRAMAVVCATNVYVREGRSWRMSVHHASPGPPAPPPAEGGGVH